MNKQLQNLKKHRNCLGDRTISTYRFWGSHELDLAQAQDGLVVAGLAKVYHAAKKSIRYCVSKNLMLMLLQVIPQNERENG
ncbi:hypothetical protein FNW02_37480 [Komarekiella sp. 'clone 1']|uniref:Uncharacterized protein n=1 Tax=Komarekiella delphini-convector SJRDD-AB1 TaxID=2593771 RepID=A0AA41BAJ8_9NOST|nr:hypothetical protein [Komarekiella delphini-convector]MBD6621235.1 hypothetical protein [Komarekiella delphini-convector SJRDD-AB1]